MWPCKLPYRQLRSPAPGDQLQNQDDDGNNEQKVNQTARHVETEAKRPKNKKNNKDGPKHRIQSCCGTSSLLIALRPHRGCLCLAKSLSELVSGPPQSALNQMPTSPHALARHRKSSTNSKKSSAGQENEPEKHGFIYRFHPSLNRRFVRLKRMGQTSPLNFQHLENGGCDAVGNFEADDIVLEHLLSEKREPLARAIEFLRNKERAAIALLEHVLHAGVNGLRFAKKIRRQRNMLGLGIDMKRGHFAVVFEFVIEECLQ